MGTKERRSRRRECRLNPREVHILHRIFGGIWEKPYSVPPLLKNVFNSIYESRGRLCQEFSVSVLCLSFYGVLLLFLD